MTADTRFWVWADPGTGRQSAFTELRHVNTLNHPQDSFGMTACGRRTVGTWGDVSDQELDDPNGFYQQNNIPAARCPKCDKKTRKE